jgi:hypothetical protein
MRHIGRRGSSPRTGVLAAMLVLIALFTMLLGPSLAAAVAAPEEAKKASTPVNTAAPTLTGTPAVGKTLTCSTGSWSGNPSGYAYTWLRDGVAIAGQSASTYVVQAADQGHKLSCQVTASNSGGEYTIKGLPSGSYKVYFYAGYEGEGGNYLLQYYNNQPTSSTANAVSVTAPNATSGINGTLQAGGQISGKVTAASGGASLANVEVCAEQMELFGSCATTNAAGEYTIVGLASGPYTVEFYPSYESKANYLYQFYNNQPSSATATAVSVTTGKTTPNINAALQSGGQIAGKVTAASGGAPLANIEAYAYYEEGGHEYFASFTYTNAAGEYTIAGLPSRSYKVEFSPGYESGSANYLAQYYNGQSSFAAANPVVVTAGSTASNINAALQTAGQIAGKVTAASGGAALANIEVCATEEISAAHFVGNCTTTNGAGEYAVQGLPTGSAYIVEFYSGYEGGPNYQLQYYSGTKEKTKATYVSVVAGSTTKLNEEMAFPGGEIAGKVTAVSGGAALARVDVCADETGGSKEFGGCAVTNANGEYTIAGLPTGSYAVEFYTYLIGTYLGQSYGSAVSVTASNTTANVNAALQTGGQISGRVTAASGGAGLANFEVCAEAPKVYLGCTTTNGGASASASTASNALAIPGGNFTQAKSPSFDSKTDDIDFFFTFPTAGTLKWSLFFRNADVGFADSLGISLGAREPALAEVARRKGKGKAKKCKKTEIKHHGKCVATLVLFASGSQSVPAGTVEVKVHADSKALKALKEGHTLHVSGSFTFQSALGGPPVAHSISTVVRLSKKAAKGKGHGKGKKR